MGRLIFWEIEMKYLFMCLMAFFFGCFGGPVAAAESKELMTLCNGEGQMVKVKRESSLTEEPPSVTSLLEQAGYKACSTRFPQAPHNLQFGAWCAVTPMGGMTLVSCRGFTWISPINIRLEGSHFREKGSVGMAGGVEEIALVDWIEELRAQAMAAAKASDEVARQFAVIRSSKK